MNARNIYNHLCPDWEVLTAGYRQQLFDSVDVLFARRTDALFLPLKPAEALLLAYLFLLSRHGHLCLLRQGGRLLPAPTTLFAPQPRLAATIEQNILAAWEPLARRCAGRCLPICNAHGAFYLRKWWRIEQRIVAALQRIAAHSLPPLPLPKMLAEEQRPFLEQAFIAQLSCLTGGAGSGKTTTAALFCALYGRAYHAATGQRCRFLLTAPTGKAAAHLHRQVQKQLVTATATVRSGTLHSCLQREMVGVDAILVDESSMIGADLLARLLDSLPATARLLLIGDAQQLPAVGAGNCFAALLPLAAQQPQFGYGELRSHHRSARQELIDFAAAVLAGDRLAAHALLATRGALRLREDHLSACSPATIQQRLWEAYGGAFLAAMAQEPAAALLAFSRCAILATLRRGAYGVEAINAFFAQQCYAARHSQGHCLLPILITKNAAELQVWNGQVGALLLQKTQQRPQIFPLLAADEVLLEQGEELRRLPALLLPEFAFAYSLSVHKSQGHEYEQVVLLLQNGPCFGREILYTALTRARAAIDLWIDRGQFDLLLQQPVQRASRLSEQLQIAFSSAPRAAGCAT